MKKISITLLTLFILGLFGVFVHKSIVFAEDSPRGSGRPVSTETPEPKDSEDRGTPEASQSVEKQDTEDQNEDTQNENDDLDNDVNGVSDQVHKLLELRTSGGIGQQVKEIAQNQEQAQEQIKEQIKEITSKNNVLKFLFGPDFASINDLKNLLAQNAQRIQSLNDLLAKVTNVADKTAIENAISAINTQNASIQQLITAQEQTQSLLGWLVKLFTR